MTSFKTLPLILFFLSLIISGCASGPKAVVDPRSVKNQEQLKKDDAECINIAKTYSLGDEIAGKAVVGAAMGAAGAAGVATAVAGAIFPPAIPFIIAGGGGGGALFGGAADKKEAVARQAILEDCMTQRGYEVFSTK